jgi:peptidoglycan/LPS O-acetylase OafA/YrhL
MSYCVNCGVELGATEKRCPLCGTVVINPELLNPPPAKPKYPPKPIRGYKTGFREFVLPLALILLIPVIITALADWLINGALTWSAYVVASILLCMVIILPPLWVRRQKPMLAVVIDWIATIAFVYAVSRLSGGTWFAPIGLPVTLIAGALITCLVWFFSRKKLGKLVYAALVLFAIAIFTLATDIIVAAHYSSQTPTWSLFAAVPCVLIALAMLIINRNSALKERIKQRFFV